MFLRHVSTLCMTEYQSDLLRILNDRGYIHQLTDADGLDKMAAAQIIPAYIGFDATAPSLHVGSLVQIMMLRRLQKAGHKPIVVMGGGTTKIGDPSGKDESRKMLSSADIDTNIVGIKKIFESFLTFGDGPTDAIMINNADWLDHLEYVSFLREIGPHFTINRMLTFESVKMRLDREQPLTFLEFNYMILQAYDFMELARRNGCRLQMGGSDQWGNIVNGIELTRRIDGTQLFGLTTPLMTTADGGKMGKTASGAVWLNAELLSPYDYWQFWRNTDDRDVGRFMRLFTDIALEEIARFEVLEGAEINDAKIKLANAATQMAHGQQAAIDAEQTARDVFRKGAAGGDLPVLQMDSDSITVAQALLAIGFCQSKGEAKRLIAGGGAKVDGKTAQAASDDIQWAGQDIKISAGKKKHGILRRA